MSRELMRNHSVICQITKKFVSVSKCVGCEHLTNLRYNPRSSSYSVDCMRGMKRVIHTSKDRSKGENVSSQIKSDQKQFFTNQVSIVTKCMQCGMESAYSSSGGKLKPITSEEIFKDREPHCFRCGSKIKIKTMCFKFIPKERHKTA